MLTRLSVSNFAIIDELQLQFQKGLTIITGETGAGKSILLGALKLVLGERADLKQLNNAEKKCVIEATFDISKLNLKTFFEENELDYENESILRRELLPSGKSRAFINDTPVTLDVLQELSLELIDIHSQFNSEKLLDESFQMQILDACADQISLLGEYKKIYAVRNRNKSELKKLETRLQVKSQESEYQRFLLEELNDANLKANEVEELEQEQKELQHSDEILRVLGEIYTKLETPELGILSQLSEINSAIQRLSGYAEDLESYAERISSAKIELQDIQSEILSKINRMDTNPHRLEEVNERLDLLHSLMLKHRVNSIEELIEINANLQAENSDFHSLEIKIENIKRELDQTEKQLRTIAEKISNGRKSVIDKVKNSILETLTKLGMGNSSMEIELLTSEDFTQNGLDKINMLFTANKGSELKAIGKSVSGGERSRLMLAIKKLLCSHLQLPTLILDEVDTGVSGKVADEVGKLMQEMSKEMQLMSITHLPQVAAKGQHHFKVLKQTIDGQTQTMVNELNQEQRVLEVAELISGSTISDSAIQQARELLNQA